jgi:hypothetical protein
MTDAYANNGPEGAHACALPAPFPWVRDVLAVLVATSVVVLAWLVHRTARARAQ